MATDQFPSLVGEHIHTTSGARQIAQLLLVAHVLLCCHWFHRVASINVDVRVLETSSD